MKWMVAAAVALMALSLQAEELRVLSGGVAKSLVDQPMGRLAESLAQGAKVDLVIVTQETLPRLEWR